MTKERWQRLGSPTGGTVMALALSPDFPQDGLCWAATKTGLFRSTNGGRAWSRLSKAGFQVMTAIAVSPSYSQDKTLLLGTQNGPYVSHDGGETWAVGRFETGTPPTVSALALSPSFATDGIAFAGTVQDGIFRSTDSGALWHGWNFGLLDLNVLALAISPAFEQDETIFAATTTALFRSKNGGRAWREVPFPAGAAPVLTLAVSPAFATDNTLFAGTETAGLFRSDDRGATWQAIGGLPPEESINGLALSPAFAQDRTILAITGAGMYVSRDAGETWARSADLPGPLCLAASPSATFVGLAQDGIWRSKNGLSGWEPANTGLSARAFAGLALSPVLAQDGTLFIFGPGEGVACSEDGGQSWFEATGGLPSLDVAALAISPAFARDGTLYAALTDGVYRSTDRGRNWEMVSDVPAQAVALSPGFANDGTVLIGAAELGVFISSDRGQTWHVLPVPQELRTVAALALSPAYLTDGHVLVAAVRSEDKALDVWQRDRRGTWLRWIGRDCQGGWASLAISPLYAQDGLWFVASGDVVYRPLQFAARRRGQELELTAHPVAAERPSVLAVSTALDRQDRLQLFAGSTQGVFISPDGGRTWRALADGWPGDPVLAVLPSPAYARDRLLYALSLGGTVWRGRVE